MLPGLRYIKRVFNFNMNLDYGITSITLQKKLMSSKLLHHTDRMFNDDVRSLTWMQPTNMKHEGKGTNELILNRCL